MQVLKPYKLESGDLIGITAPSSPLKNPDQLESAKKYFEERGYKVKFGKYLTEETGYLAGSDEQRLEDLHLMFEDEDVKAIVCLRGGYGAIRYIDRIDYKLIRRNPKIFIGFSDITTLQLAIFNKARLITFAGPMVNTFFGTGVEDDFIEDQFWSMITSSKKRTRIQNPNSENYFTLVKGRAEGRLLGGNLTSMIALIGTEYLPTFQNSILLLEEIAEQPYKIDRYFNMLRLQGILDKCKGIILGRFVDCYETDKLKATLSLNDVIEDYMSGLGKPILYNVNHGHVESNITLPIGAKCKVNSSRGFIEIVESVVR